MIYRELFTDLELSVTPEYGVIEKYHHSTPRYGESEEASGLWQYVFSPLDERFGLIAALEKVKTIAAGLPIYLTESQSVWLIPHIQDLIVLIRKIGLDNTLWNPNCDPLTFSNEFYSRYVEFGPLVMSRAIFALGFSGSIIFGDGIFYPERYIEKRCQNKCQHTKRIINLDGNVKSWLFYVTNQNNFKSKLTRNVYRNKFLTAIIPEGESLVGEVAGKIFSFTEGDVLHLKLIRCHTTTPSACVYFGRKNHQIERPQTRHEIEFSCASLLSEVGSFVQITYQIPEEWVLKCGDIRGMGESYDRERMLKMIKGSSDSSTLERFMEIEKFYRNR